MERGVGFRLVEGMIEGEIVELSRALRGEHPEVGGVVTFEGLVRNHHGGRTVTALEYAVYPELALREGDRIVAETAAAYDLPIATAIHRVGPVPIGEMAVWIIVGAAHRDAAFTACRTIIDRIKETVPIWKHEWYGDGHDEWILGG